MAKQKIASHDQAFLEDICANPADDDLRLIYADWLEDNGDPERARFIREQIRGEIADWAFWSPLQNEWRNALPTIPGIDWGGFRNGFIESVYIKRLAAFEEAEPLIRRTIPLRMVSSSVLLPEMLARPCFAGLDRLSLYAGSFTDSNAGQFAAATTLQSLTSLDLGLGSSTLTPAGLRILFSGPNLRGLLSLSLRSPESRQFGAEAARILAEHVLPGLTDDLCLYGWDLAGVSAAPLAAGRNLTSLRLVSNNLGDAGIATLCAAGMPARTRSLLLSGNEISPAGAAELASYRNLPELHWLVLHDNPLTPEGMIALAERAVWRPSWLYMSNTRAGDAGIEALAQSPLLGSVEDLQFASNRITPAGVAALANSPQVGCLRRLDLRGNGLKEADRALLASSPRLAGLKTLTIWG
jgi:uncharacterized protein (TIGR02996 family)